MKNKFYTYSAVYKRLFFLFLITSCTFLLNRANAQVLLTSGSPTYTQNFNSFSSTATAAWADNGTLANWYALVTGTTPANLTFGTGSSATGALYNFGIAGTGLVTDRALGAVLSSTIGPVVFGLKLQNNDATGITSITLSYTGEQWRRNTATTDALVLEYSDDATSLSTGNWTPVSGLNFVGPAISGSGAALDGNAAANRTAKSATFPVPVPTGATLWVRWSKLVTLGSTSTGLAIDDLTLTASYSAVACATPTGLSVGNITDVSALASFTSPGTSFVVEYGSSGFTPGTGATAGAGGTVVTGTSSPISITGLTTVTTYDVYVRQNCSGTYSSNSPRRTFKTAPTNPVPQSIPYSQNFSGLAYASTTYPSGWQGWTSGVAIAATYQTNPATGNLALTASADASTPTATGVCNYNGKIGYMPGTSAASADAELVLAIDASSNTGSTNILVQYDVMSIRQPYNGTNQTRINETTLQYRIGNLGNFTSLSGCEYQTNTVTQTGAGITTPVNQQSKSVVLPLSCNGQSNVQLRWAARSASGSGNFPSCAVTNVSVTVPTNPPVANYSTATSVVCPNACINFTDLSTNGPTAWAWTFSGGTPNTSTARNPSVCYTGAIAGTYAVSLTATNAIGSNTVNGVITVSGPLTGTYSVGPTGNYPSITAALVAAGSAGCGFTGNVVFELQPSYVSTAETFPITFSSTLGSSYPGHTITIRPAAGATGLVLTQSFGVATLVDLNGVQGIIIDGRPGGTGGFVSTNLSLVGSPGTVTQDGVGTVRFINDAQNNQVVFCTLTSAIEYNLTAYSSGIVCFSTSAGGGGNSNNTIDHCLLQPTASTQSLVDGITSIGTAGHDNTGNVISNNSFDFCLNTTTYYFPQTAAPDYGIYIGNGSQNFTITGNSFYASYDNTAGSWSAYNFCAIGINPATGPVDGTVVSANYVGGSAAQCGGVQQIWGNNNTHLFRGIMLKVGTTTPTSVQGNTFQNLVIFDNNPSQSNHALIDIVSGSVNVGTVTPNLLGSQATPNSVVIKHGNSTAQTTCALSAIRIESTAASGAINIQNNLIGGITGVTRDGAATAEIAQIYGIYFSGSGSVALNISGNTIGNATTHLTGITNTTPSNVYGIYSPSGSSSNTVTITNNTIDSLTAFGQNSTQYPECYGILISGSWACNITGNTVKNLVNKSIFSGVGVDPVVAGISVMTTSSSPAISQNQVYALSTTTASTVGAIIGIRAAGTSGSATVTRNLIYALSGNVSNTAVPVIRGIQVEAGVDNTIANNMVSVGLDASGNSLTNAIELEGIYDLGGINNYYFNSVNMAGGSVASGTTSSFAFKATTASTRNVKNNIFYNGRSNASGTGKNYAVSLSSASGLTINGNDYFADGTGNVLGFLSSDRTTLSAWQAATSQDAASISVKPIYTSNTDLHLQTNVNCAFDGTAVTGTGITNDYDNDIRNSPADIGADEFTSTFAAATAGPNQNVCGTSTSLAGSIPPSGTTGGWTIISGSGGTVTTPSSPTSAFNGTIGTTYQLAWTVSSNIGSCTSTSTVFISFNSPIGSVNCGGTNVSCNGGSNGSASVAITGGTSPFTYAWSNGATSSAVSSLAAGTYTVTVSNGCGSTSCSYTVTAPAVLGVSASSNTPACLGDTIFLFSSVTGGTANFTYLWTGPNGFNSTQANPSITNVTNANGGTYSVTVTDAHGCTSASTTTVAINNCTTTLNLKMMIEGYYVGSGLMNPAMYNESVAGATMSQSDTIIVELHNATTPYALAASAKTILMTNGNATAVYGAAITGGDYYVVVKHRNTIETWSSAPVSFTFITSYDFTTAQTQAFGGNQILVDAGLWAFYNGDINQDLNIDLIDFPALDFGINHGLFGYFASDLNGDGNVDLLDFPVLDANINAGIFAQRP